MPGSRQGLHDLNVRLTPFLRLTAGPEGCGLVGPGDLLTDDRPLVGIFSASRVITTGPSPLKGDEAVHRSAITAEVGR
jgi:hypothetical protein